MHLAAASFGILSFAWYTLGYFVVGPHTGDIWSCGDWQTISWDYVVTDPAEFSVELTDQSTAVMVGHRISRDRRSARIRVPKIASGNTYRIDFIKNQQDKTIFAQSGQFEVYCPHPKLVRSKVSETDHREVEEEAAQ